MLCAVIVCFAALLINFPFEASRTSEAKPGFVFLAMRGGVADYANKPENVVLVGMAQGLNQLRVNVTLPIKQRLWGLGERGVIHSLVHRRLSRLKMGFDLVAAQYDSGHRVSGPQPWEPKDAFHGLAYTRKAQKFLNYRGGFAVVSKPKFPCENRVFVPPLLRVMRRFVDDNVGARANARDTIGFVHGNGSLTVVLHGFKGRIQSSFHIPNTDPGKGKRKGAEDGGNKGAGSGALLGAQILLVMCSLIGGFSLFIYTFENSARFSPNAGALRILFSSC